MDLVNDVLDANYKYERSSCTELDYAKIENAESNLNSFIKELTNDNQCQN